MEITKEQIEEKIKELRARRGACGNRLSGIDTIFDGRSRSMSDSERAELLEEEEALYQEIREIDEKIKMLEEKLEELNKKITNNNRR